MFFVLSKTLNYLAMPLVIIILCLLLSVIVKRASWKKWLFRIGFGLLLFCSNDFIVNEVMRSWELPATPFKDITRTYEWGILLTGVAQNDAEPRDRVHFGRGADRVTHTVQLYKMGIIKKVLVSGGTGRLIDIGEREADELASALIMMGVDSADIVTENNSRNTHDSAIEVKKLLEGQTTRDQCLLITSGYHMRRSLACFTKAGWQTDTFTAETLSHKRIFAIDTIVIPKVEALTAWHTLVKEWIGMLAYRIAGYI